MPYLPLMPEDVGQRRHDLRANFIALRWRAAAAHSVVLEIVKLAEARRGFALLLKRWAGVLVAGAVPAAAHGLRAAVAHHGDWSARGGVHVPAAAATPRAVFRSPHALRSSIWS